MKVLILYKSKYGATKEYAEMVHQELPESDIFSIDQFDLNQIDNYDTVIIGSCTYTGMIKARPYIEKNWDKLKSKKIFLFAVGLVFNEDAKKSYEMFPEEIRNSIQYIKIPGRIVTSKLNFLEKMMVKAQKGGDVDKVEKKNIEPVVAFARG